MENQDIGSAIVTTPTTTVKSPSDSALSIETCTASSLASHLLTHRFDDDAMKCASFFLECAASLPNAASISESFLTNSSEETNLESNVVTPSSSTTIPYTTPTAGSPIINPATNSMHQVEVSCINPRGRFTLTPLEHGILLTNKKKETVIIPRDALGGTRKRIIVFPKPESCTSKPRLTTKKYVPLLRMVLLPLKTNSDVKFRNKAQKQVCFSLSMEAGTSEETEWINLIRRSFTTTTTTDENDESPSPPSIVAVRYPNYKQDDDDIAANFLFKSDTGTVTNPGAPFVSCYQNVNQGSLFPMEEGLLFFKPPLFLPREDLRSIGCGRGGNSNSRYVDMTITLDSSSSNDDKSDKSSEEGGEEEAIQFTNINREELGLLRHYIDNVLTPAMVKDAADDDDTVDADDGDADDGLVKPDEVTSVAQETNNQQAEGRKRKSTRGASVEAQRATKIQLTELGRKEKEEDNDSDDEYDEDEEYNMSDEHDTDMDDEDNDDDDSDTDEESASSGTESDGDD